jgi:hypothetical protein
MQEQVKDDAIDRGVIRKKYAQKGPLFIRSERTQKKKMNVFQGTNMIRRYCSLALTTADVYGKPEWTYIIELMPLLIELVPILIRIYGGNN